MALQPVTPISVGGVDADYLRIDRLSHHRDQGDTAPLVVRLYKDKATAEGNYDVEPLAQEKFSVTVHVTDVQNASDHIAAAYKALKAQGVVTIAGQESDLSQATNV
jgi:hypothetical protein